MSKSKKINKIAVISAIILLVTAGLIAMSYYIPSKYVSVDINPSIEYSVNMYDRVINAKGVNEDGIRLLEKINVKELQNKDIKEVVSMTIDEAVTEGYLLEEGSKVMIATAARNANNASELAVKLQESVQAAVVRNNSNAEVVGEAVGFERVEEARELGVTPGKLNLVEKLISSSSDPGSINKEEWLNKSVKEIMAKTNENKEMNMEQEMNQSEEEMNQEQNANQEENRPSDVPGQASPANPDAGQGAPNTQAPAQTPGQASPSPNAQGGNGQN